MSVLWTLRKHVDAIAHREEEAQRERDRQVPGQRLEGDGGATGVAPRAAPPRPRICRVCGHRATSGDAFCPECPAETMIDDPQAPTGPGDGSA